MCNKVASIGVSLPGGGRARSHHLSAVALVNHVMTCVPRCHGTDVDEVSEVSGRATSSAHRSMQAKHDLPQAIRPIAMNPRAEPNICKRRAMPF
jgi:hypothetical protein